MTEPNATTQSTLGLTAETRTWCDDCYGRRDAWVIRYLQTQGVTFGRVVVQADCDCHSCGDRLRPGVCAVRLRIPLVAPPNTG